jgi:hypothetical protein
VTTKDVDLDQLLPFNTFCDRYGDSVGSKSKVRYQLRNRRTNGLDEYGAVVQRGKLLWINVARYRDWLIGAKKTEGRAA